MSFWKSLFNKKPEQEPQKPGSASDPNGEISILPELSDEEIDKALAEKQVPTWKQTSETQNEDDLSEEKASQVVPSEEQLVHERSASVPSDGITGNTQSEGENHATPEPSSSLAQEIVREAEIGLDEEMSRNRESFERAPVVESQTSVAPAQLLENNEDVIEDLPDQPELTGDDADMHEEDLSVVDGEVLPELSVPGWRDELEFVKDRYEPCDLTNHIVKVSKRRLVARRIDLEVAQSRLNAFSRYLERASRRFKDRIDEDRTLNEALQDFTQWKTQQSKSVAWQLAERIDEELRKAKTAELEATAFIQKNTEFTNARAVDDYRYFARRVFLIPLVTLYLISVVGLTYGKFGWFLKFLPFFNLGLQKSLIMISGVGAFFWLGNFWKFSKKVSKVQRDLHALKKKHDEQYKRISHAVKEHTRLAQQKPLVEPILNVLAKAYRVQLQSDISMRAHATTLFDPSTLPACVTLARAVSSDDVKISKLKNRALSVLMRPGWRTNGLNRIARIHAESKMLDANALSLKSLDTDSLVSARNAQKILLEAFNNTAIHERVSKQRLIEAIKDLHFEVLAKWESSDRPRVVSLRDDGFNKLSFRTSWLEDEDLSEDWIDFLREILVEETSPFSNFNLDRNGSEINKIADIKSVAVVPHYFKVEENSKIQIERSELKEVTPLDVVVRVDVSPWAEPSAFAVFADGKKDPDYSSSSENAEPVTRHQGGYTRA